MIYLLIAVIILCITVIFLFLINIAGSERIIKNLKNEIETEKKRNDEYLAAKKKDEEKFENLEAGINTLFAKFEENKIKVN